MRYAFVLAALACACAHAPQRVDVSEPTVVVAHQRDDDVDAAFRAARAEYDLGRREAAAARLRAIAERPDASAAQRANARVQEAVCRIELGDRAEGERLLRATLEIPEAEPSVAAQAEFWLGGLYGGDFRSVRLDPAAMDDPALSAAVERKAELLLSAQGHYLRAIRRGDPEWATAAGSRIGELYETFHDDLVAAPLPPGLSASQRSTYVDELHRKVRVLVEKAIGIYEETLDLASRTGARTEYRERTEAALRRLRALLLGAPAGG